MKKVLDSSMVAHIWAQRIVLDPTGLQAEARNATSSMSFRDDKIFSYSTIMGEIIHHKKKVAIILNHTRYSNTTTNHRSTIHQAIGYTNETPIFDVFDVERGVHSLLNFDEHLISFLRRIKTSLTQAGKSRSKHNKDNYLISAKDTHDNALSFIEFFEDKPTIKKWKQQLDKALDFDPTLLIKAEKRAIAEFKRKEKEKQDLLKLWSPRYKEAWINKVTFDPHTDYNKGQEGLALFMESFSSSHIQSYIHANYGSLLRFKDKKTIETSLGAEFPVTHALKAWKFIKSVIESATSWHRNGSEIRVGSFHVDSIDDQGNMKAGCHSFKKEELLRFGKLLEESKL